MLGTGDPRGLAGGLTVGIHGSVAEQARLDEGELRVLVENGEYWLRNRGDIAMMVMTVERLRARWPRARIGVLTHQPAILRALLPTVEPISGPDWDWPADDLRGRVTRTAATKLVAPLALRWRAATDGPKDRVRAALADRRERADTEQRDTAVFPVRIPPAAERASLVLALGGGYLTDVDRYQAHRTLDLLDYAAAQGIPTAMLGQGIGPLHDSGLLDHARKVLPSVDLVAVRESRRGPGLLTGLGVHPERVMVTGDDAVEFGYRLRDARIGANLGLCLRVADYARVSDAARATLGTVVRRMASELDAGIVPLIISEYASEDRRCTLPLLDGSVRALPAVGRGGTARDVARQVADCRLLVTSAYHLAVFALSQGIPAIGITVSEYYDDKFHGLAQMFGAGLRVVHLDSAALESELSAAVAAVWNEAPAVRDALQQKALEQIEASRAALARACGLVEERAGNKPCGPRNEGPANAAN